MEIDTKYLHAVQAALEQWTDQRVIGAADLEAALLFLVYGPKVLSQIGVTWKGFVCRQKNGRAQLTVKGVETDTPLVVFVTSDTPTGCMVRFLDLMEQDKLNWVRDRYPWI